MKRGNKIIQREQHTKTSYVKLYLQDGYYYVEASKGYKSPPIHGWHYANHLYDIKVAQLIGDL